MTTPLLFDLQSETKICIKCGIKRNINRFVLRRDTGKYRNTCKDCTNQRYHDTVTAEKREKEALYRRKNKEKMDAYNAKYYQKNKEDIKRKTSQYVKNNRDKVKAYKQKYYHENKQKILNYSKNRYEKNKDRILIIAKEYRDNNDQKIKEYAQSYRQNNKEKSYHYNKEYYLNNKQKIQSANKRYKRKNNAKINAYLRGYYAEKRKNDPVFKLKARLREGLRRLIDATKMEKDFSTLSTLKYSAQEFKDHIESQWEDGMSWGNHGLYKNDGYATWHIDHKESLSSIIANNPNASLLELHMIAHDLSNLQPLWAFDNLSKGA